MGVDKEHGAGTSMVEAYASTTTLGPMAQGAGQILGSRGVKLAAGIL